MPHVTQTVALLAVAAVVAGCSKSSEPPTSPGATPTITITASGASPRTLDVALGSRVRFVNNDTRAHNMSSDPHPDHTECPEINQAGFLQPGQSRETGNLVVARTCGFHDHDNPDNQGLRGAITIR